MSLGYTGYCKLYIRDDSQAVYKYSGENWNDGGKSKDGDRLLLDGLFTINLSSLEEPEIHEKVKRFPSGRKKKVIKRITHVVSAYKKYDDGDIVIDKKCKNAFVGGRVAPALEMDYIANKLIQNIYEEYQRTGEIPEVASFIQ